MRFNEKFARPLLYRLSYRNLCLGSIIFDSIFETTNQTQTNQTYSHDLAIRFGEKPQMIYLLAISHLFPRYDNGQCFYLTKN